jgi:PAS domain S-box-containing protein
VGLEHSDECRLFQSSVDQLLGYLPEEVTGSTAFVHSILHPADVHRLTESLQAHLDGRTPLKELELRLRHKSGEYRWYLDRGKVVARDRAGQRPLRMVGTITDITERKQAERERAEALSHSADHHGNGARCDLCAGSGGASEQVESSTGDGHRVYARRAVGQAGPRDGAAPRRLTQTSAAIRRALRGRVCGVGGAPPDERRASRFATIGTAAPFADLQGRVVGITGVGRDVTDRQQTEALLRSSEERFRLVAQATNDILWDWDLLTGDHWWSPNACEKFGYDPHERSRASTRGAAACTRRTGSGCSTWSSQAIHTDDQHPLRRVPLSTGRRHLWVLPGSRPYRAGRGRRRPYE